MSKPVVYVSRLFDDDYPGWKYIRILPNSICSQPKMATQEAASSESSVLTASSALHWLLGMTKKATLLDYRRPRGQFPCNTFLAVR